MISLKYSCNRTVNVNRGLAKNWQRAFEHDDIRVPDGWEHSLEINGRMYRFAFARVSNAKIKDDTYIVVVDAYSREEALGHSPTMERYYICPVMAILQPFPEEVDATFVDQYLRAIAATSFTEYDKKKWIDEKKLRIC